MTLEEVNPKLMTGTVVELVREIYERTEYGEGSYEVVRVKSATIQFPRGDRVMLEFKMGEITPKRLGQQIQVLHFSAKYSGRTVALEVMD